MLDADTLAQLDVLRKQRERYRDEQDRAINVLRNAINRERQAYDEMRSRLQRAGASVADYKEWLG